jgi:hypothetical protein
VGQAVLPMMHLLAVGQLVSGATRYRSAVVIPGRSPVGRPTRIRCNLSGAEEDTENA